MRRRSTNHPFKMLFILWTHYDLLTQLVKRDILTKYRGSFAGLLWMIIIPLLMLSLYTLVFGVFMHVQWPGVTNYYMYSFILYVGLIILNFFSECLSRSPTIIVNNANFVKKVVFPLELYPWVIVISAFIQAMINIIILALFSLCVLGKINITILTLPLLFVPLILMALGISWFLSSAGVYVRDIAHGIVFVLQILMYITPIFYSIQAVPEAIQPLLYLNPLTFIVEQARQVVIFGQFPLWSSLGLYFVGSFLVAYCGYAWFQMIRKGFADVL